jgi:hypothetical protein
MEESINNPEPPVLATAATNNQPKEADPLWPEAGKSQIKLNLYIVFQVESRKCVSKLILLSFN